LPIESFRDPAGFLESGRVPAIVVVASQRFSQP